MSQTHSSKTLEQRIAEAVRRRLHPNTNLHVEQLAYATRLAKATVWNALAGNNVPNGRTIFKLVEFFGAPFLHEIFGGPNIHVLDPRDKRKAEHIREIARLQAELEAMG